MANKLIKTSLCMIAPFPSWIPISVWFKFRPIGEPTIIDNIRETVKEAVNEKYPKHLV